MTTTTAVAPYPGVSAEEFARWRRIADDVAAKLAATALERDRANATPVAEVALLRESGLLGFATPAEFGGAGGSLAQALELSRVVAAADGSIGQLVTYHYSNGLWTYLLGTARQWEYIARGVGERGWFQGSVSNPRDPGVRLDRDGDGYRINGSRTFATGVAVADYITVLFYGDHAVNVVVPPDRPGLAFGDDWDNLGQRLTASGSVTFDNVEVRPDEVLGGLAEFTGDTALRDGLRGQFSQLVFVNLYLGIAEGALSAAAAYVREHGRPWFEAGVETAVADPYHRQLFGRLSANVAAGIALAEQATRLFEDALAAGAALRREDWGLLALRVDQAKSVATEASLDVAHQLFAATGARSTANSFGLDIYWRNLRTHTVHDPVAYRQREIGDYHLTGTLPAPLRFGTTPETTAPATGTTS
ncbi:acyl-CoA dehydrogenase family protein [Jiangella endophytica]|uniref:acyl-CoA dehydrogenase family protein n=1 Tax=Jiangella endophytica TaxID=1623398 RepID=UPI000E34FD4D|nr:acyl-CoA dehydrogenase family protein [Jiangella endophytica]